MANIFIPQVAVVDFHHHRGPEIEFWIDIAGEELYARNDWAQLPFLALPDGAHASSEEFSYFSLVSNSSTDESRSSLFGLACTRQIRADRLKNKSVEVTRSFVQKAVVIVVDEPGALGRLRERLATITAAWFAQEDFFDTDILKEFQATLKHEAETKKGGKDAYFGLSLRELIYELRHQTLVLFKCFLLQKRVLFFGTRCERLCMTQFALVSLIPHLLESLQDCASPDLDTYAKTVTRAAALRTSERSSLLAYMGLPLQIFGKDSFFSPYTPLQQLDFLSSPAAISYVAGSTNTLFLSQRDLVSQPESSNRYCDVLVNLDESSPSSKVIILDPELRNVLSLSAADRRWIDHLTQTVIDTWNSADPSRPTTHGYQGSEDAIRLSFEEYILSLLSSVAYKAHFDDHPNPYLSSVSGGVQDERYPDPIETANDFNSEFLRLWKTTPNHQLWFSLTSESSIFDIVEPRHPTAGGLNVEDVQRRFGAAVAELHLDERVRQGRETAGKALEAGRERVGAGVARFWKEVEGFKDRREASRSRETVVATPSSTVDGNTSREKEKEPSNLTNESGLVVEHPDVFDAARPSIEKLGTPGVSAATATVDTTANSTRFGTVGWAAALRTRALNIQAQLQRPTVNLETVEYQAAARENATKAGAYLNSWGSWARDKGKEWQHQHHQHEPKSDAEQEEPNHGIQRQVGAGAVAAAKSAVVAGSGGGETKKENAKAT